MNQAYLKGYASDMTQKDQENGMIFFAIPMNVAAFLALHRNAAQVRIVTLDEKPFLTGSAGFIDACPDRQYLRTSLLPSLAMMQQNVIEIPELVSAEVQAQGYQCPMPDWNYLWWDGLSDEAYRREQKDKRRQDTPER